MCVYVVSVLVGVGMVTLTSPVTMPTFDTTNITSNHLFFARSISVAVLIKVVVRLDFIDRSTFTISGRQLKTDPNCKILHRRANITRESFVQPPCQKKHLGVQ